MKILLLGKNGQVGWELQRALAPLGEIVAFDRHAIDLTQLEQLRSLVAEHEPDWIVNAAAYTAVDKAQSENDLARRINAEAVGVLAEEAKRLGAWLIHYSTDYVYDGQKEGCYSENDAVNPLSVYGKTKLAGEVFIRDSGCKHLIFRTSWVFAAKGANFAKSMIRLAKQHQQLNIVADQYGAPTSAELIADVSALCLQRIATSSGTFADERIGTYHLVSSGEATWHSYAQYVIDGAAQRGASLKASGQSICAITTADYPLPAPRPHNSRLSTDKLQQAFAVKLPIWTLYVDRMLEEMVLQESDKS